MSEIVANAWLRSHRDYQAGLQILRDHQVSAFVIELLEGGPDDYNTRKLAAEVAKIAAGNQVQKAAAPAPVVITPLKPADQEMNNDHDLQKTLSIKEQIRVLFKEISFLRGKLLTTPEGTELYELAKTIVNKELKKGDLWDALHYFEATGKWFDELPENQKTVTDLNDPEQLERKIKNLMANRSKASSQLKKPLPASKQRFYQEKVDELTKQIETLTAYRNG